MRLPSFPLPFSNRFTIHPISDQKRQVKVRSFFVIGTLPPLRMGQGSILRFFHFSFFQEASRHRPFPTNRGSVCLPTSRRAAIFEKWLAWGNRVYNNSSNSSSRSNQVWNYLHRRMWWDDARSSTQFQKLRKLILNGTGYGREVDGHRALFTLGNIRDDVDPSRVYFDDFVIIFSVARVEESVEKCRWLEFAFEFTCLI